MSKVTTITYTGNGAVLSIPLSSGSGIPREPILVDIYYQNKHKMFRIKYEYAGQIRQMIADKMSVADIQTHIEFWEL